MKPRLTACCSLNLSLNFFLISMMGPISTSLKVVSMAVVFLASTNLRLIVLRRLLIFSGLSFLLNNVVPGNRPGLFNASSTSCFIIFPLLPDAVIFLLSTFVSAIMAAATGVAFRSVADLVVSTGVFSTIAAFFDSTGAIFFSGALASVSIDPTRSPIANVSPSLATCFTRPACSAFISKVAFSLSNSAITSSLSAQSPSFFSHFTRVTSLMLSPTVGTFISIDIYANLIMKQISGKIRGKSCIFKN